MDIVKTGVGETYDSLSVKHFGTSEKASMIKSANPSVGSEPIAGSQVVIPKTKMPVKTTGEGDDIVLLIGSTEFKHFSKLTLKKSFDSFDTCYITAPSEPENQQFLKSIKLYSDIQVSIGGEPQFVGTLIQITASKKQLQISCYSKCAVINESCAPISAYPLQEEDRNLKQIAESLIDPFPFDVESDADVGANFENFTLKPTEKIAKVLESFAKERDIIITNNEVGNLLLTKASSGSSVASLKEGLSPLIDVYADIDGQKMYTDYTAILPVQISMEITGYTAKNRAAGSDSLRFDNFLASKSVNGDEKTVAESRRARGISRSIKYRCELATLRDSSGTLYSVNTYVNLKSDSALVYNDTKLFIRGVDMVFEKSKKTCTLHLTLPEAFNGSDVRSLPWD